MYYGKGEDNATSETSLEDSIGGRQENRRLREVQSGSGEDWEGDSEQEAAVPGLSQLLHPLLRLLLNRKLNARFTGPDETSEPLTPRLWYIFPDGLFHLVPVEMLRDTECRTTPHFGQKRPVQLCLRSLVASSCRRRIDFRRGWLGLGAVPATSRFFSLKKAGPEIEEIGGNMLSAGIADKRVSILTGSEAHAGNLETALVGLEPAVLHIAAHGYSNPKWPDACTLILAPCPDRTQDKFGSSKLSLQELDAYPVRPEGELLPFRRIRQLPLRSVELVVLSACWGSTGRTDPSGGLEGLVWAFFEGGVGQVIASRYPVDDEKTARFMIRLYSYLVNEPVAEALGRTRDDCLRDGMDPVQVGAWSLWG